MKKFFITVLVFLFLSCGNSSKHVSDNDSSAENHDTSDEDIETVEDDDIEPDYDTEISDDDEIKADEDEENTEDEDIEPFIDPCLEEPCKNIENSTGNCIAKGKTSDYICVCDKNHVWFSNKRTCEPLNSFKGLSCTGQTKCYDNEKEIPCPEEGEPFFGQDANYAEKRMCLPQNFTIKDYEYGQTVIDHNSGREWMRQLAKTPHVNSGYCTDDATGGYHNWRLPNTYELLSIIDNSSSDPAINEAYFPDTPSALFYSDLTSSLSTRYMDCPDYISYYVDFSYGETYHFTWNLCNNNQQLPKEAAVRCVRTAEKHSGCELLTFSSEGYKISNSACTKLISIENPVSGKNWKEALEYCENLVYAGLSDWRLPNRKEITYLSSMFGSSWTSTTAQPDSALIVNYSDIKSLNKTQTSGVRCVTFDPCPDGKLWTGEKCVLFDELDLKEDGSTCKEGYKWEDSRCIKICDDELCNEKTHSTGLCLGTRIDDGQQKVQCQCEESYFTDIISLECINPCDPNPCTGEGYDGNCIATSAYLYSCGCKKGYYFSSGKCIPVTNNDCYVDYFFDSCINNVDKIMWSSTSEETMEWKEAKKYCEDLEEAEYTDWRLPKVEELWTFARSCTIAPKEACEASESNGCLSEECISQCTCQEDHNLYLHSWHWSSSLKSDDPEKAIALSTYGYFLDFRDIKDVSSTKCVRNIE